MTPDDFRVRALTPPAGAVQVLVAPGAAPIELAIAPTMHTPREDLVIFTGYAIECIHGISAAAEPPWAALTEEDVVLASVRMPALTSTVQNSQIVDRRAFDESGRVARLADG